MKSDKAKSSTRKAKDLATVTTNDQEPMTTNQGQPISTDQNSLRVATVARTLMEDQVLCEKIQHFDHERIPERVVHARGAAAPGIFQVYDDSLSKFTVAKVLTLPGLQRRCSFAFPPSLARAARADTARDVPGFAVKNVHSGGQLGSSWQQYPSFIYSGCDQIP